MDLSLPIDYNGFSVNTATTPTGGQPRSGYLVDEVNTSEVEIAAYTEKKALADGIDASDVFLGRRRISMIVSVFGSTKGDFWDKQQDLLSAFTPTISFDTDTANLGFLPLNFYQPTADIVTYPLSTYPYGIPLRYYVRSALLPAYTIKRDDTGGQPGGGLSLPYRLTLIARNPRKVSQAETTSTTAGSYNGDYPSYADIRIVSGSATGDGLLTVDSNVLSVSIDAANATYLFLSESFAFYKNGVIRDDLVYGNSTPFIFDSNLAGGSKAGVFAPGAGSSTINYIWREAFA